MVTQDEKIIDPLLAERLRQQYTQENGIISAGADIIGYMLKNPATSQKTIEYFNQQANAQGMEFANSRIDEMTANLKSEKGDKQKFEEAKKAAIGLLIQNYHISKGEAAKFVSQAINNEANINTNAVQELSEENKRKEAELAKNMAKLLFAPAVALVGGSIIAHECNEAEKTMHNFFSQNSGIANLLNNFFGKDNSQSK